MNNYYEVYDDFEKKKRYEHLMASMYRPQPKLMDEVGSGGNINARLVAIVGREGEFDSTGSAPQLSISLKSVGYGEWQVLVLNCLEESNAIRPVLTTKDKLDEIRDIFGLSISHLANVLITSRPSLHAWLDGSVEPRDQSIRRIDQIHEYAKLWKGKSPHHYSPGRLMRQRLGGGTPMLSILEREHLDDAEIQEGFNKLLQLMERQRSQMDRAKRRSRKTVLPKEEQEKTRHQLTSTIGSR